MPYISRIVAGAACAVLIATGASLAQNAPPPQPMATAPAKSKQTHPPSKCKTKPNGCPKRKKNKTTPPPAGGTMPQPAPTH